ncbi:hypothetical protein LXL04_028602 [Taraxacum kok-saghyz]
MVRRVQQYRLDCLPSIDGIAGLAGSEVINGFTGAHGSNYNKTVDIWVPSWRFDWGIWSKHWSTKEFMRCTVTVLALNQFPFCASAHESDRVVQMSRDILAVLRALMEIGSQLRDSPPKQIISISPTYNLGFVYQPTQQYVDPSSAEYGTLGMMNSTVYWWINWEMWIKHIKD